MRLKERVALITGGGTGMGRATALLFAQEGAAVAVNYSQSEGPAKEVVNEIETAGGSAWAWKADVSRDDEVRGMFAEVERRWGRLDVLVNNAGWTQRVPHANLEDLTDEIWDRTLNINLRGCFYCMRAAVPLLRKGTHPSIVNIASTAALHGGGSSMAYAASKAGVISLTKSMARAMAPEIRVNAIAPGLVKTRFAGWPDEAFEDAQRVTPLGRIPTVEEVAETALFFATGGSGITGESVVLDGGLYQLGRIR